MIDRKKYLELCQFCSSFLKTQKPDEIPGKYLVSYDGLDYYPVSYILEFDEYGIPVHKCIIHDIKANSHIKCLLSKIELKELKNDCQN